MNPKIPEFDNNIDQKTATSHPEVSSPTKKKVNRKKILLVALALNLLLFFAVVLLTHNLNTKVGTGAKAAGYPFNVENVATQLGNELQAGANFRLMPCGKTDGCGVTDTPAPNPTCTPRPPCLDAKPACDIPEPAGGWCSGPKPTCVPRPACLDARPACKIPEPVGGYCPSSGIPSPTEIQPTTVPPTSVQPTLEPQGTPVNAPVIPTTVPATDPTNPPAVNPAVKGISTDTYTIILTAQKYHCLNSPAAGPGSMCRDNESTETLTGILSPGSSFVSLVAKLDMKECGVYEIVTNWIATDTSNHTYSGTSGTLRKENLACGAPTPTCVPRPACLDARPACKIPEPVGGYCPNEKPTCIPRPACLDFPIPCEINENPNYCPPVKPTCVPRPACLDTNSCPFANAVNPNYCPPISPKLTCVPRPACLDFPIPCEINENPNYCPPVNPTCVPRPACLDTNSCPPFANPVNPNYCPPVKPTCVPRPACLDAKPACKIPEPVGGYCPTLSATPTSGAYSSPTPTLRPGEVTPTPTLAPGQTYPTATPIYVAYYPPNGGQVLYVTATPSVGNNGSNGANGSTGSNQIPYNGANAKTPVPSSIPSVGNPLPAIAVLIPAIFMAVALIL